MKSFWLNVMFPNIHETYQKAAQAGCAEIQPVTQLPKMGVSNAMFADASGYSWMLRQIHREASFKERFQIMENME